jgi:hypothetical protein
MLLFGYENYESERSWWPSLDRILRKAVAEFAAKGFSGARINTIALRAKTNIRMIYHYFGSKEKLSVERNVYRSISSFSFVFYLFASGSCRQRTKATL